jgi:hypothetical protein
MVYIVCDNDECGNFGAPMEYIDTDDRQEWCKETYECSACGSIKIHETWRDQNGLVIKDEVYNE